MNGIMWRNWVAGLAASARHKTAWLLRHFHENLFIYFYLIFFMFSYCCFDIKNNI